MSRVEKCLPSFLWTVCGGLGLDFRVPGKFVTQKYDVESADC